MREAKSPAPGVELVVHALMTPRRLERAPSTAAWGARQTLDTAHGAIAFWTAGTGAPVLLVHGWEATHADFDAFVAPLVEAGRQAVALDLPAHGETSGEPATLPHFASAIGALAAHTGPLAAVIAHSVGCPATAIALHDGMRAERAVLIAGPAVYEKFVRETAAQFGVDGNAVVAALIERGIDVPSLNAVLTAARLELPALFIHSEDDRVVDIRSGASVAAAWRGSRFVRVNGLGHSRILRDPAVVAEAVAFATA